MRSRAWWLQAAAAALMLSAVVQRTSETTADPDLWGHVRFGEDLFRTGRVVRSDTYSYLTGDRPWYNHEWLAEAAFYGAFGLGGTRGLVALKLVVGMAVAGAAFVHMVRSGATPIRAGILLLAAQPLLIPGLRPVRPQMFTLLLFLVVLLLIQTVERGHRRWLWSAPPLFALWANLHGGFLAGLGLMVVWVGVHALVPRLRGSLPPVALATAASVLATFANPYGPRLLAFLLRTATVPRPYITEWQPIAVASWYGFAYLALLGVAAFGLASSPRLRLPSQAALLGCVALLPLLAIRHAPLFAVAFLALAGEHVAGAWARRAGDGGTLGARAGVLLVAASLAGALGMLAFAAPRWDCIRSGAGLDVVYPHGAVDFLRRSGAGGNLAVHFDWGEYVLWHLGPRVKVSIDGRRETVYSDETERLNLDFTFGVHEWDALLQRHPTEMALVSREYPVFQLLRREPGWLQVYEDTSSAVFVRRAASALPAAEPSPAPADVESRCFP